MEFGISYPFGSGHFETRVRLYAGVPRIDVQTSLVNNDERVRYRAALPTTIRNGTITYEIPFGAIERPEGEFPAQNWIDYSDEDKGVSLLNRGLPGGNVVDGVVMLSLLKCTAIKEGYDGVESIPTEEGYEIGKRHVFDYSIAPHQGDWRQAQTYRRGSEFNTPLIPVKVEKGSGELPGKMSFLKVSGNSVVVSAVKLCGESVVVRIYEAEGKRGEFALEPAWKIKEVFETNLIEKEKRQIQLDRQQNLIRSNIDPFEIKTFKLNLASELF